MLNKLHSELKKYNFICGSDEVGLGAWAGPLVVCSVITPTEWTHPGLTDSKKLSSIQRKKIASEVSKIVTYHIVEASSEEIDREGISQVWKKTHVAAIQGALKAHSAKGCPDVPFVIVDGIQGVLGATPLPKADQLIPAVSAASVLAKVHRDQLMCKMDTLYPDYGFKKHVGYGVPQHKQALEKLGVTPIHRKSYSPIAKLTKSNLELLDIFD